MTISNKRLEKDSNGQWVWKYDVEYSPPKRKSRLDNEDKDLSELFGVKKE